MFGRMTATKGGSERRAAGWLVLGLLVTIGCGESGSSSTPPAERTVVATNYPVGYFAERLIGDDIRVVMPVPDGKDPAGWSPDDASIALMQKADLIVVNGAGYEEWREQVSLPEARVVDTTKGDKRLIEDGTTVTHSHGPEGEHSHTHFATHTWLDPGLALAQASKLQMAIVEAMPDLRPSLQERAVALNDDLKRLELRMIEKCERTKGWNVIGSHPVYQYLGARLGWTMHDRHWEPDETPSDEEFAELEQELAARPAKLMLWEDEPTAETRERLEAMGLTIVVYRPCGRAPSEGDWLSQMEANLDRLIAAIDAAGSAP